ncbi:MAG: formate dehydrogenase subunit gamma [Smithellaceae bacterium]|nr:formate dehydrogenase subunit gamma [Smithellaceae bacterium]
MKKEMIQATSAYERFIHWLLALSCLLLCLTGVGMMYHSLNVIGVVMGGLQGIKSVHNVTGVIFLVALLLAIQMWWKEAGIFVFPEDWEWTKAAGGYLWHVDKVPEVGKYNPGQKMFFLTVALCGLGMVATGLAMWFPFYFPMEIVRWMYPLHVLGFAVIFAFFFVHLYLGTIGSPGSLPAMLNGWVTRAWLRTQHPKWLKEMEETGSLVIRDDD